MASEVLTEPEIQLVINSWDTIRKNGKTFGNQLFLNLFAKHPTYQQLFKSLANIPLSELGSSKRLLAHSTNVMYAISALVDNLGDPEVLTEMLTKTGSNHFRHKVNVEMFDELGPIFVDLLKTTLSSESLDEQLLNAWIKTYTIIVKLIKTGYPE